MCKRGGKPPAALHARGSIARMLRALPETGGGCLCVQDGRALNVLSMQRAGRRHDHGRPHNVMNQAAHAPSRRGPRTRRHDEGSARAVMTRAARAPS